MDDDQKKLFNLMELAEQQQQAVGTALAALDKSKNELKAAAKALQEYGAQLVPDTAKAADEGATKGVKTALENASKTATDAVAKACEPLLAGMAGVATQAGDAETKLKKAIEWFNWRWAAIAGSTGFGAILATYLICQGVLWKQRSELDELKSERDRINAEVATAQTTLDVLNKKTGGVRYIDDSKGRFIVVPKVYEEWDCVDKKMRCIRLK